MLEYKASTVIDAPPEKVWEVLTNLADWPQWDPYCDKVEGQLILGKKVKVYTKLNPGKAFPVKVAEIVPNQRMTWTGGMPFGLFKGERTFVLTPVDGKTEFTMREVFSGPMLGPIGKSLPDMTDAFEKFVEGLKTRVES